MLITLTLPLLWCCSYARYSFSGAMIAGFIDQSFYCLPTELVGPRPGVCPTTTGDQACAHLGRAGLRVGLRHVVQQLARLGVGSTYSEYWTDVGALAAFAVFFRIVAFFVLYRKLRHN